MKPNGLPMSPWTKLRQEHDREHRADLIEQLKANRDARQGRPYRSPYSKASWSGKAGR